MTTALRQWMTGKLPTLSSPTAPLAFGISSKELTAGFSIIEVTSNGETIAEYLLSEYEGTVVLLEPE